MRDRIEHACHAYADDLNFLQSRVVKQVILEILDGEWCGKRSAWV